MMLRYIGRPAPDNADQSRALRLLNIVPRLGFGHTRVRRCMRELRPELAFACESEQRTFVCL